MIRAVLIDDEQIQLTALASKISTVCPQVQVIEMFDNPLKAQQALPALQPDVIFLDIEMPHINGFTLLKNLAPVSFEVIFTTAYSEYAIEALRISALDFLLKPIDPVELKNSLVTLEDKIKHPSFSKGQFEEQLKLFFNLQQHPPVLDKIALPVVTGLEFIEANDIVKIEGLNVYAVFHLSNGKKITVSRTLKECEHLLVRRNFIRVHKSFIINLQYLKRYIKGEGGSVILTDGSEVEVSRRSKNEFLKRISE